MYLSFLGACNFYIITVPTPVDKYNRPVLTPLIKASETVGKVLKKNGFEPDWETDEYIYEVKTSNWWVDGTAGEKVLGTWIKYQEIPKLYGKPLRIICIANQEHESTYGKTKFFGEEVSDKTKTILELAKSWGIEYIRFSDFISDIDYES